jgi:hypothetical protein
VLKLIEGVMLSVSDLDDNSNINLIEELELKVGTELCKYVILLYNL